MDERLQDLKSAAGEKKDRQRLYLGKLSGYWRDMARLAVLQERKLDAMAFYQNALLARLDAGERDIPGETDEFGRGQEALDEPRRNGTSVDDVVWPARE